MITINTLRNMKATGDKIAMLTCYDASFSALMNRAGVDILLIGDSLGMAVQGQSSTLPVRLEDMCYHTAAVARGNSNAMIVADLPFGAYQQSPEQAFAASAQLMAAGAHMVKLEGGAVMAETTRFLQERAIPVCAHIGLTPQYVNVFGGYKVQGRGDAAQAVLADAKVLPHHRHRRGCRYRRPSIGHARYAGHFPRQNRQIRPQFHAGANIDSGGRGKLCTGREKQNLPNAGARF